MRNILLIALLIGLGALWAQGATLPSCYYTYAQISQMLADHQAQHPDIAKRVQIGFSQQDQMPIYAFRITDNVNVDEDEPALLFVGQVHAEEVLGVQGTMSNIAEILSRRNQLPYNQWINQLDMWFVPTLNPEGHKVVTDNIDTSWRKNKRDNNNNDIFDYSTLIGFDPDGVDINRNFSFNWCHGDTLFQPGGDEVWDYYRGPASMSESENQAIQTLTEQYNFIYSICWHSSRTGRFSEKSYYSFNWKDVRPSPDMSFASAINASVAGQIVNEAGTGTYESLPNTSRKGAFHDWMYQQYGTFQLLIECGTRNLQPDSTLMVDTVNRMTNGVKWLLNRALPSSSAVNSSSMLFGNITDAVTGEPLEAEIIIQGRHAPWFRPRLSKPAIGRYWKALPTGSYTVELRKRGYWNTVVPSVMVYNLNWTMRNFTMQPKQALPLICSVRSGNQPLNATVTIYDPEPVELQVNGDFVYSTFEGEYPIEIRAEGYFPFTGTVNISSGSTQHHFQLSPATVLFSENWENGTGNWSIEGPWVVQNDLAAGGSAITDSWGGNGFYAMNCDVWLVPVTQLQIPSTGSSVLTFDSHLYTEYGYDFAYVEASTDSLLWNVIWTKSGRHDYWNREYASLADYAGSTIFLRFHLTDQSTDVELTDPGWTLDNIQVLTGTSVTTQDDLVPVPALTALYPNYPNPFNPETTISYSLAAPQRVKLAIFNIRGQNVRTLLNGVQKAGNHQVVWDGKDDQGRDLGSGVYLYRLESGAYSRTMKMMLIK